MISVTWLSMKQTTKNPKKAAAIYAELLNLVILVLFLLDGIGYVDANGDDNTIPYNNRKWNISYLYYTYSEKVKDSFRSKFLLNNNYLLQENELF